MPESNSASKKNPNALLIAFRKYHTWFGVVATLFVITIALTGIYLNHKDLFKPWLGKPEPPKMTQTTAAANRPPLLTTATDLTRLPVTLEQAMAASREQLGEEPIERIELKPDHGRLVYKIKTPSQEIVILGPADAAQTQSETAEPQTAQSGELIVMNMDEYEARERKTKGTDWGKILKDIHTGKIAGLPGKLTADTTAAILILLSATGIYLWIVPKIRKRRSTRSREAAQGAAPAVKTTGSLAAPRVHRPAAPQSTPLVSARVD